MQTVKVALKLPGGALCWTRMKGPLSQGVGGRSRAFITPTGSSSWFPSLPLELPSGLENLPGKTFWGFPRHCWVSQAEPSSRTERSRCRSRHSEAGPPPTLPGPRLQSGETAQASLPPPHSLEAALPPVNHHHCHLLLTCGRDNHQEGEGWGAPRWFWLCC